MIGFLEDERYEFKEKLNDKLEKEVVSFLNGKGGYIYLGVSDKGEIVGLEDNLDDLQLAIKDRIKNNIAPSTLGLFDISVLSYEDKKYLKITIAMGSQIPYYIKKKGMTSEGCFLRVGSSCETLTDNQIESMYESRVKKSLLNIESPEQDLAFSQLKIYYEEKKFPINENFFSQLNLYTKDGKFNYLAYLLSDYNTMSIKFATYSGEDVFDLIECEEYGYCSLIKALKMVLGKFELINKTYTRINSEERRVVKKFDMEAVKEAVINAFVHNLWERENPPKFELFSDHISITSTGGLARGVSKEDFLKGCSSPTHPELMRIFKDLELVEQLGTGVLRILKTYNQDCFEFLPNFIRVNFY